MKDTRSLLGTAFVVCFAVLACTITSIGGGAIQVTKTEDSGIAVYEECTYTECSLRAAIMEANERPGQDTIVVPPGVYVLTRDGRWDDSGLYGDLDITDDLIIEGAGKDETIIDGNLADRVFHIHTGVTVELRDLQIVNGDGDDPEYNQDAEIGPPPGFDHRVDETGGGGIANRGDLTLSAVLVKESAAPIGGGVLNLGTLSIVDGTLQENTAEEHGGGLYNQGVVSVKVGFIVNNTADQQGGGVYNAPGGELAWEEVGGVDRNHAGTDGGGLFNDAGATMRLTKLSSIRENSAGRYGGGVFNQGALEHSEHGYVENTARSGGGIYNDTGGIATLELLYNEFNAASETGGGIHNDGSLILTRSTLLSGEAGAGGAIFNGATGTLTVINATIGQNQAALGTGGVVNAGGAVKLVHTTIAENSEGVTSLGGTTVLINSIVAGNIDDNCIGDIVSTGHNLDDDHTCGFMAGGDLSGTDPQLGTPAWVDGSYYMYPLEEGSPAIDAGDNSQCPDSDQRGLSRPQGLACDLGAFEFEDTPALPLQITSPTPTSISTSLEPPVVNGDTLCWLGPGPKYEAASALEAGEVVELLGRGELQGWMVIQNPRYNVPCWVDEDELDLDPRLDLDSLQVFSVPPLPTATIALSPTEPSTPQPSASLSGMVWKDENGDGNHQGGEGGLANVTVRLGQGACDASGYRTTTSGGGGSYSFGGLPAGTYCVSVNVPQTCEQYSIATTATKFTVHLGAGDSLSRNFGFQKKIC